MAKKDISKLSPEQLREELEKQQELSDRLQREKEDRDRKDDERKAEERRAADARAADARAAAAGAEPSEEQWTALEKEYGMERDDIRKSWKLIQRATAPLQAELATFRGRDAASEAVRLAKEGLRVDDPQFPKYERFVDEYLGDISLSDKSDPEKLKRHLDRAVHYAQGKARKSDKSYREDADITRDNGSMSEQEKTDAAQHFGEFAFAGMPLTIQNDKLVPDDFRKRHQHPDQKEGVRMNERHRWSEGVPKKPR